jgi:CRP-like cAMP-binding protein
MLSLFKRSYSPKDRSTFRFLRKNQLFHQLTDDELAEFLPFLHLRDYRASEAVFFRGDPSQALYVVKDGRVSVSIDVEGRFEELYTVGSAGFFGENALLSSRKRLYHATCQSEVAQIYVIPHLNIAEILDDHPRIKAKIVMALAIYQNQLQENLFKAYQSSFGFFELSQVFR